MSARRLRLLRPLAGGALVLILVGWIVREMLAQAEQYDWTEVDVQVAPLAGASALLFVTYLFRSHLWTLVLRDVGAPLGTVQGMRVFMGSQLGRYLPGKLWQIAGSSMLARQHGVSASAAAFASILSMLLQNISGGVLALLALDRVTDAHTAAFIAIGVGLSGIVFLASPALVWTLRLANRLLRREDTPAFRRPTARLLLILVPSYLLVWLAFGTSLVLTTTGLFPTLPYLAGAEAVGIFAASAVIGFAVLVAPSGLGVREAVMISLLQPITGLVPAGLIAIAHRIIMTTTELVLMLWGAWPWLTTRRPTRDPGGHPPCSAKSPE
jgi:glycosyltransferase 2 family protein